MSTTSTQTATLKSASAQDSHWATLCVVTTTVGHSAEAEDMARALVAAKAAAAPKLDGVADDAVWKSAAVASFKAVKGANFKDGKGETQGTVQAAYVGDAVFDLQAAHGGGVDGIGVTWGAGSPGDLRAQPSVAVVDAVSELRSLLDASP